MNARHEPYWTREIAGRLRPAIMAYLECRLMDAEQIALMRAYLTQWIAARGWAGPMIDVLRTEGGAIRTRADIKRWLDRAEHEGIDPL